MRRLIDTDVLNALLMRERKMSTRMIAGRLGCCQSTIVRRLQNWDRDQRISVKKTVRKRKLTGQQIEQLKEKITNEPEKTLKEVQAELNIPIHWSTVGRYAKNLGRPKKISPKKFCISNENTENRYSTALLRLNCSNDQWNLVVFTDEFGCDNSDKMRRYVFRPQNERFNPNYVLPYRNTSLPRVNFFAWVASFGVGELIELEENMNSNIYCQIMYDLVNHLREVFGHQNFKIYHANAAFAKSRETRLFKRDNDLNKYFISVPAYSPDMNLIENLFGLTKNRMRSHIARYGQPTTRQGLIDLISEKWNNIPPSVIQNLYSSLPRRMQAIVNSNGKPTKY